MDNVDLWENVIFIALLFGTPAIVAFACLIYDRIYERMNRRK